MIKITRIEANPRLRDFNNKILLYNGSSAERKEQIEEKKKKRNQEGENKETIARSKLLKKKDTIVELLQKRIKQ